MALQIANSFPPKAVKAELLRNVWSCQNPAEQPPTSGIQTVADTGSEKSSLLLLPANKVMLIRAQSDVQGFL